MLEYRKIRVSSSSSTIQVAGSIIHSLESGENVELRAVGAGAVSQMYKAIASARGTMASKGRDVYIKPGFDNSDVEGDSDRTVMVARLVVL